MAEVKIEDVDIEAEIERVIMHYPPLVQDRHFIQFSVQNGGGTLSGYTRTRITRSYLVEAVRRLPGVVRVDDSELYSDDDLRLSVGSLIPVGVSSQAEYGVAILTGSAPPDTDLNRLLAAVAAVKGVRRVYPHFMQP